MCLPKPECMRKREGGLDGEGKGIFESDKLKSHDVLKLRAEKKG